MTTTRELVANKPLSGTELAKIILSDVADVLSGSGMLTHYVAYGRVSYEVLVRLHLDSMVVPESTEHVRSKPRSDQQVEAQPELAAIHVAPPLTDASDDAAVVAIERHRDIISPNAARLEHGLPVAVEVREQNGATHEEHVVYPASEIDATNSPPPQDVDLQRTTKEEWSRGFAKKASIKK